MNEVWAAIVTTDRVQAFAALCNDLVDRCARAGASARLLVVENSTSREAREANAACLARAGVGVELVETGGGASIAESRLRARALVADLLGRRGRPRFVWMLDDDVRLRHVVWSGERLDEVELYNHVEHLLRVARRGDLDVLIGEVSGDPPIPAVATLTTRVSDLAANVQTLFAAGAGDRWTVDAITERCLSEPDAYYDLSVDRDPPWMTQVRWLPRHTRATVRRVWAEVRAAAQGVPFGVDSTRPILARPVDVDALGHSTRRGGNAVFFDVDACVEHEYPSVEVGAAATRRSDMIGTRLLKERRKDRVRSSAFSVAHRRPVQGAWPTRQAMIQCLLDDTFGALLAREVDARLEGRDAGPFVERRLGRMRLAAAHLRRVCEGLEELLQRAPAWAQGDAEPLRALLRWVADEVPFADGRVDPSITGPLEDPAHLEQVRRVASRIVEARA